MKKPSFSHQQFKKIYSQVPRLTVEVIIVKNKKVLLTLRSHKVWQGLWHIPGGTVLYDESIKNAVDRIAKDELGIKVNIIKLLGYTEYPSEQKARGFGQSVGLAFLCKTNDIKITLNKDAIKYNFFDKLPENIIPETKVFLQKHLNIK